MEFDYLTTILIYSVNLINFLSSPQIYRHLDGMPERCSTLLKSSQK